MQRIVAVRAGYGRQLSLAMGIFFGIPLVWAVSSFLPLFGIFGAIILALVGCMLLLMLPFWVLEYSRALGRDKRRKAFGKQEVENRQPDGKL